MSQRRKRGPACSHDNCGSRRLHLSDDGFTYCDQGHQQSETGPQISTDTGELVQIGRASRIKVDSDAESTASRVSGFSGPKAFEHYLLCLQLVLRKQLRWLIDVQHLPEELETLVKDLWALRLHKLQNRVSFDSDAETDAQSSRVPSSQSEGGSGTDTETAASHRNRPGQRTPGPNLMELLCLIHLGMMLLKIPITIADMHKWCKDGDLLFYCAVKEVPLSMRDRLPATYQDMLQQHSVFDPDTLHRKMLKLVTNLHLDFGMEAPALNQPLVLYRWVKLLALPLEIYVTTQRLARLLEIGFSYDVVAQARSSMSMRFPEVRLMTLVVIATKLLFPFDDKKRYPKSADDLATMKLDWDVWRNVQDQQHGQDPVQEGGDIGRLTFHEAFTMTEADAMNLAEDRLDQYLDWFQSTMASEEVRERGRAGGHAEFRRSGFRMFPTDDQNSAPRAHTKVGKAGMTSAEKIIQVQAALQPKRIVPGTGPDDIPRAGTSYAQYKEVEDLSETTLEFYKQAALLAGFSLRGMVRATHAMEQKLFKLEKAWKKRSHEQ